MTKGSSRRGFLASLAAPPKLDCRPLGNTGLKVTTVGFGCMITSDASVIARALDMGINYFDTARVYGQGNNERMVGTALKGRRDRVYISSKTVASSQRDALVDLDITLRELKTDYLDIWYLHSKEHPSMLKLELIEAQRLAKKAGKIRFSGVSHHAGHRQMIPAVIRAKHFDVLLTSYNFAMDPSTAALLQAARESGIGVVAMKVMAGGFRRETYYPSNNAVRNVLKREGAMLAALKWVLANPYVDTAIPSMVDTDQLEENIRAMAAPFDEADRRALSTQLEHIRPLYCRMCGQCTGACPRGLPVPDVLRYLAYAEGYGQFTVARDHFQALPSAVRRVRCADCGACAVHCPNGVAVPARLARAQEWLA